MKIFKTTIKKRSGNTFCVPIPKSFITHELFSLGQSVQITIENINTVFEEKKQNQKEWNPDLYIYIIYIYNIIIIIIIIIIIN